MTKKNLSKIKKSLTRAQVIQKVKKNGFYLEKVDSVFKKDKEIVMLALESSYGYALEYADISLRKDKNVVMAAIQKNGSVLECADKSLRKDKNIVMAAIKNEGMALEFAGKSLKKNRKIIMAAIKQDGYALRYSDKSFKKNKGIVMAAIQNYGCALQFADKSFKKDKEIVMAAIQQDGRAIKFADKFLRTNKEFVLKEIAKDTGRRTETRRPWDTFFYLEDFLKKDKEFVLDAIERNGSVLIFIDQSFRNDRKFNLAAVQRNGFALFYVYARFRKNKEIVLAAVKNDPFLFKYIDKSLQKKPDILKYKNCKRIDYSNGDVYIGKLRNSQRHGRGKYLFANGDEEIGIWKKHLYNGVGRYKIKDEYNNIETRLYKVEDGKLLYICTDFHSYEFFISNQRQFNNLIKNWLLFDRDNPNWQTTHHIQFRENSIPEIFNKNFHKLANIGDIPYHIDFISFLPIPKYNKYFLKLMNNNKMNWAGDKTDFAHTPNLHFKNVKFNSQRDISLVNQFFVTFLSDIYGGESQYDVSEIAYDIYDETNYDPKNTKIKARPRKGVDLTNIKPKAKNFFKNKPDGDGEFRLTINDKVIFDSIEFSKNFDYKKLYEIYELDEFTLGNIEKTTEEKGKDQKKFKREIRNYFNNFFKTINFTNYFKIKKINTISFIIESDEANYRNDMTGYEDNWDINEEWEKISSL